MKVIAKKILYEQDLYQYPDENVSYGLFPIDEITNAAPPRKNPVLVHRKGEIREWKFEVQGYCCFLMEKAIEAEQVAFEGLGYFEHRDRNSEEKIRFAKQGVNLSLNCACWPIQLMKINYCPFCGKKIEIEEKE